MSSRTRGRDSFPTVDPETIGRRTISLANVDATWSADHGFEAVTHEFEIGIGTWRATVVMSGDDYAVMHSARSHVAEDLAGVWNRRRIDRLAQRASSRRQRSG